MIGTQKGTLISITTLKAYIEPQNAVLIIIKAPIVHERILF